MPVRLFHFLRGRLLCESFMFGFETSMEDNEKTGSFLLCLSVWAAAFFSTCSLLLNLQASLMTGWEWNSRLPVNRKQGRAFHYAYVFDFLCPVICHLQLSGSLLLNVNNLSHHHRGRCLSVCVFARTLSNGIGWPRAPSVVVSAGGGAMTFGSVTISS